MSDDPAVDSSGIEGSTVDGSALVGQWLVPPSLQGRADELVLVSFDEPIPPSRQPPAAWWFDADGTCREGLPGPTDRREWVDGHWQLDGETLVVSIRHETKTFAVVELSPRRLVLRPAEPF